MAPITSTSKHTSRRRAAALKFLSTISFENETTTSSIRNVYQPDSFEEIIPSVSTSSVFHLAASTELMTSTFVSSLGSDNRTLPTFRERSNSDLRRSFDKYGKTCDNHSFLTSQSSSESLISLTGNVKLKADIEKNRSSNCSVKAMRPNNLRSYRNERILLVSSKSKIPFSVFSIIQYKKIKSKNDNKKEQTFRTRNFSGSKPLTLFMDTLEPLILLGLEKGDSQMISYQPLLSPTILSIQECSSSPDFDNSIPIDGSVNKNINISSSVSSESYITNKLLSSTPISPTIQDRSMSSPANSKKIYVYNFYSPDLLDNPEFTSGRYRTVLSFPSYRASIIDFVKPVDLKKELNELFRERFPNIQLSLSKLRSLKRDMKKLAKNEKCVDLLTIAQSYVYFEKLILRNIVNKSNRKMCAAACLLLSAKMNDTKGAYLKQLIEKLESIFRVSRKDVLSLEFSVVVSLEFSLYTPLWEILPHYQRLIYES